MRPEAERNVADAVQWIERAAADGADFVSFPETYPGPWRMPATFDPSAALAEAASDSGTTLADRREDGVPVGCLEESAAFAGFLEDVDRVGVFIGPCRGGQQRDGREHNDRDKTLEHDLLLSY